MIALWVSLTWKHIYLVIEIKSTDYCWTTTLWKDVYETKLKIIDSTVCWCWDTFSLSLLRRSSGELCKGLFTLRASDSVKNWLHQWGLSRSRNCRGRCHTVHRSDSIQGTDYIATPVIGFPGQKFKIYTLVMTNQERLYLGNLQKFCNIVGPKT